VVGGCEEAGRRRGRARDGRSSSDSLCSASGGASGWSVDVGGGGAWCVGIVAVAGRRVGICGRYMGTGSRMLSLISRTGAGKGAYSGVRSRVWVRIGHGGLPVT
jgi:hypothetical protein